MAGPTLFLVNGVRMDLDEYLDFLDKQKGTHDYEVGVWNEDWSVPDEELDDDTHNRRWED